MLPSDLGLGEPLLVLIGRRLVIDTSATGSARRKKEKKVEEIGEDRGDVRRRRKD